MSGVRTKSTSGGGEGFCRGGGRLVDIPIQAEMSYHSSNHISMDEHNSSPACGEEDNTFHPKKIKHEEDSSSGIPTTSMESTSSTRRPCIQITLNAKGGLQPERECQQKLKEAIETKFCEDVECWTKINPANRDIMFDYWKSFFQWDSRIPETQIRKVWEKKAAYTFKQKMYYLRSKAKGKKKPQWLPDNAWGKMKEVWSSPTYKSLSERNAKNRASDCGGRGVVVNRGGAMSRARYQEKLRNELGREPSQAEIWSSMNATQDEDGHLTFHSAQAEAMLSNYLRAFEQHPDTQGQGDGYQPPMELQRKIWLETQGISKKGAVVGLASDAKYVRSFGSRVSSSTPNPSFVNLKKEVEVLRSKIAVEQQQMKQQLKQMKQQMEQQMKRQMKQQMHELEQRMQSQMREMVQSQIREMMQTMMAATAQQRMQPSNNDVPQSSVSENL